MLTKSERIRGSHSIVAPARNLSLYLLLAALTSPGANSPNRVHKAAWPRGRLNQDVFGLNPQLICVANNEGFIDEQDLCGQSAVQRN